MNNSISAAVERFAAEWQRYQDAAEAVGVRVQRAADEAKIGCTVKPRAKGVRSFQKKIFVKEYKDPWHDVTDKAGMRAIVHSMNDVDRLLDQIRIEFGSDVLSIEDKREVLNPALLAYSGVHVQVVAEAKSDDYEAIECEIQIRTAAQDAWSIVSHQVLYKPLLELPPQVQHSMYRLVALVEMFDEEVQRVMDLLPTLPGTEVLDLLEISENEFLDIAHSSSNRDVGVKILQAIAASIDPTEREDYRSLLQAFIASEREKLVALFEDYGEHGDLAYIPSHLLFSQAESLIILERLTTRPHLLVSEWRRNGLPDEYLDALAGAAAIPLPEP
jgi:ppGpp synthetase/RelA/SpoT-type nucleotidyltranferase